MTDSNGSEAPGLADAYVNRERALEDFEAAWKRGEGPGRLSPRRRRGPGVAA
jgi:hypothetical protein